MKVTNDCEISSCHPQVAFRWNKDQVLVAVGIAAVDPVRNPAATVLWGRVAGGGRHLWEVYRALARSLTAHRATDTAWLATATVINGLAAQGLPFDDMSPVTSVLCALLRRSAPVTPGRQQVVASRDLQAYLRRVSDDATGMSTASLMLTGALRDMGSSLEDVSSPGLGLLLQHLRPTVAVGLIMQARTFGGSGPSAHWLTLVHDILHANGFASRGLLLEVARQTGKCRE